MKKRAGKGKIMLNFIREIKIESDISKINLLIYDRQWVILESLRKNDEIRFVLGRFVSNNPARI